MTLGAVLGAALNSGGAHPKSLTIDGLDVIGGTARGNRYGVPLSSIQLREEGSGRVSNLSFTIDDPLAEITVGPGQRVVFYDHAQDLPIFRGFVESWEASPWAIGRTIDVSCVGIECLLDWLYVPAVTIPAGVGTDAGWQLLVGMAVGPTHNLRAFYDATFGLSTQATPIGDGATGAVVSQSLAWKGGSLRQACQAWADLIAAVQEAGGASLGPGEWIITVDMFEGLKIYRRSGAPSFNTTNLDESIPTATLRTTGAVARPSATRYGVNAGGTPRQVYVKGTGAGSGVVSDGSGVPGPTAVTQPASSTTATDRVAYGNSYLAASGGVAVSGTVGWDAGSINGQGAGTGARLGANSLLDLTDPNVGLPGVGANLFWIRTIDKTYTASEEHWTLTFGGIAPPRLGAYIRALTPDQIP